MQAIFRKTTLVTLVGAALVLGGCASNSDVEKAQSTADQALSTAQQAQQTAQQAMSAAQSADQKADQALSTAQQAPHKGPRG